MLPKTLINGLDQSRLRSLLLVFFLALALPTVVLIWQAYGQLKWEAFHQYRGVAEELSRRIDARLNDMMKAADARSFADYSFLVVTGDPGANFVQRSPLSAYPVTGELPGVLGYFQVDTTGAYSTPLLPPAGKQAADLGIGEDEYAGRLQLARKIQTVLADNRLLQSRPESDFRQGADKSTAAPGAMLEEEQQADEYKDRVSGRGQAAARPEAGVVSAGSGVTSAEDHADVSADVVAIATADKDAAGDLEGLPQAAAASGERYSQQVFDQLNESGQGGKSPARKASGAELDDAMGNIAQTEQRANTLGKVSDLRLDAGLQKKSEQVERKGDSKQRRDEGPGEVASRMKRKEQITLPEAPSFADRSSMPSAAKPGDLRISTFESEIDPFEFSLLDSGHAVLFRKVWRSGERYIQGLLLDRELLVEGIIGESFADTALSGMSNLIVAYQEDVIQTFSGRGGSRYSRGDEDLAGTLLYRNRLAAPLDSLELIFSINRLPPGPGAGVLGWVALVLGFVFVGGFVTLYRLGLGQINLARQQQDFVSAVSHELKTPLTSIRMYGEMLKEGWADEDKRQSYYEFIHDESERLSRLISNVLQLARITRNEPDYNLKSTNVGELMSNIESRIASQVERAGFDVRFSSADGAERATINIDEDCFAQIIINLVDNAIKFSGNAEEKIIEISCGLTSDRHILFSVRDHGPGVPNDQMKKIFNMFYRSESELTRETVGTGIGLAIVHQLTLAMGGKVDLVNRNPGAEFRVWFEISEESGLPK